MQQGAAALTELNSRFGRVGGVRFEERYGGLVALLSSRGSTATVALRGAQVLSFIPPGHDDVLWLSPVARLDAAKAVRGGIPICWPWFGPHAADPAFGAHGFVRAAPWQVIGTASNASEAAITMRFETQPTTNGGWPHAARAELSVTLGEMLSVALTTTNLGSAAISLTEALHNYLRVGDIASVSVSGLENVTFIDQLSGGSFGCETRPIGITGEIDRIYQATVHTVRVTDTAMRRRIFVAKSGSQATVVWNPAHAKSEKLGDLGPEGYRRMLCIETANAGKETVTIAPGEHHRIETRISVERL